MRVLYVGVRSRRMRGWMEDRPSYIPPVGLGEVMRACAVGAGRRVERTRRLRRRRARVRACSAGRSTRSPAAAAHAATPIPKGTPLDLAARRAAASPGSPRTSACSTSASRRRGETVVVSGAAGATGSIAAQIAKIQGCRVIGIAGGAEKVSLADRDRRSFDAAIDYKREDVGARLRRAVPEGHRRVLRQRRRRDPRRRARRIWRSARGSCCAAGSPGYNESDAAARPAQPDEPGAPARRAWRASS